MNARKMKQEQRAQQIKAVAEAMAGPDGTVRLSALASAVGLSPKHLSVVCRDMRLAGWHIRIAGKGTPTGPKPGTKTVKGQDRVDPARVEEVLQDAYRGMGDGRHERDDPRRTGQAPWSGRAATPEPTLAEVVARLVREWKVRTGRIRAKAEPAPGSGRASRAMCNTPRRPGPRADATACVWRRNLAPGSRAS